MVEYQCQNGSFVIRDVRRVRLKMVSELDFDKLFKISLLFMKINRSHPNVKRDMKWALQFLLMHGIFSMGFCLLLYSTVMHDFKNIILACGNGTIIILYTVVSFQYFMMIWHQDKLRSMFETMKSDFANAECSPEEQLLVLKYSNRGRWVVKLWLVVGSMSATLFPLKSILFMMYSAIKHEFRLVPVYDLTYPKFLEEIKNNIVPFTIVYTLMVWYAFYAASMYIGLVPMGPICMLHACSQLEIAKRKVDNFYPIDGYRHEDTMKNMMSVAKQLQNIYR